MCRHFANGFLLMGSVKDAMLMVELDNMEVKKSGKTGIIEKHIETAVCCCSYFFYLYSKVQWSKLLKRYGSNIYSGLRLK